ncbi:S8/S53 family peptidase [Micromonospora sp. CPCC 206061]|uniref:S8/S53 family peptidase n=1 Tax=Micromonospora sp. CPCC 206061 TaxID=3122410 RepID=UPI002FF22E3F
MSFWNRWRRRYQGQEAKEGLRRAAARALARDPEGVAARRLRDQTRHILEAFGDDVAEDPEGGYLYRKGWILVREELADHAIRILGGQFDRERVAAPAVAGVRRLPLSANTEMRSALDRLLDGDGGLGEGAAGPEHILSISDVVSRCPAVEPEPVDATTPDPAPTLDLAAGQGVRVVVVDTGLDPDAPLRHRWLDRVDGEPDPAITPGGLLKYAGHGTFIAGVIRCLAPRAEVYVTSAFWQGGALAETEVVRELARVLATQSPDIICLSAGTRTYRNAGLLAFDAFNRTVLRQHKGVVLVAAAGNDASRVPFWPAASPFSVSVGALNSKWDGLAEFSNHGGWVDVSAPGENLVNAFPVGTYTYQEAPNIPPDVPKPRVESFTGMARWSGTSFSTPLVAGLIAARMSHTGENGRDAAAALVADGQRAARLGVGAVLHPR